LLKRLDLSDNKYRGAFLGGSSAPAWLAIILFGGMVAFILSPRPGDREAQAAKDIKQDLHEAWKAQQRDAGLPDFIPESQEQWATLCVGWPNHAGCKTMREVGYPFLREEVESQCGWERQIREESPEDLGTDTSGAKLSWRLYDPGLTPAKVCTAYGIELPN